MNQWLRTFALTVVVAWTSGTARASDNVPASPPKTVTKSWHLLTVNEIIRDFLVQVEFDAKRWKNESNEGAAEVFKELEKDIKDFDRDLDETTRQLQWSDKRFDKHRNRLDQIAKRVEKSRLPSVPFSM